ncbi:hypothetical protein QZH45_27740 [Pseudomonas corrugata]|uniref:Uncharacterized protein n=1 Tax=Pseudomonas corrugata TaxID=47879 RepID=A0A3M3EAS1_9PSED|nr:hypothetical protein [Pseudomonas corrugata]AOE62640.1 hypothetical protein AXG94_13025 [Pseudomonas corrugata]MDU9034431.1 hypothetical protein [Pseudomonas corrugata]MDU9040670.1 hypothetical protein [Pseudomonas corrugata]QTH13870.1 hypothetical protein C4C32_25575 [Pseudomonas corrugata]RMM46757.1 hypothetical protein ALQ77_00573 [Pseudomonas corrugata]
MDVKIGGATLAVILAGMLIALGVNECQRGPLNPEVADGVSEEQKTWLTIEHRIKRSDPSLTAVTRDQQTLTVTYRPDADGTDEGWVPRLLRVVGHGLAALNNAPGGTQYPQVTVKARLLADDDVELVYDMRGFDAIKTQRDGYTTFASLPRSLTFDRNALAQAQNECRDTNVWGFYPDFCERVKTATVTQP